MAKKETSFQSPAIPGRFRYKVRLVLRITFCWAVLAIGNTYYDFVNIKAYWESFPTLQEQEVLGDKQFPFWDNILANVLGGLLGGLLGGSLLVFYLREKYGRLTYGRFILITIMAYLGLIYMVAILISFAYNSYWFHKPVWSAEVLQNVWQMLTGYQILGIVFFWFTISCLTSLVLQINDKFGPGVFYAFIMGRYYRAKPEVRIFMFLDLKSSTTIAEKLGNVLYHQFLQEFYADITNPILYTRGHIYQYVGDEVVLSWSVESGVLHNNCIRCFFEIQEVIDTKQAHYQETYGYVPQFKAGLHYGEVLIGEVGILKKELVFTGDVLNTTARIQEQCKVHQVPVLLSGDLLALLDLEAGYTLEDLGSFQLRGKTESVEIFSLGEA